MQKTCQNKSEKVIAISTKVNNATVYVRGWSIKNNGKLIPHFTNQEGFAHDFITEVYAAKCINDFVNPNNRLYQVVTLTVPLEDERQT